MTSKSKMFILFEMRTIYGVVPTLTSEGNKTGSFVTARIDLNEEAEQGIKSALANVKRLLPTDTREEPLEYRIDISDQVSVPELQGGRKVPDEMYIRISLNRGLLGRNGSFLGNGTKPKREARLGIVEIVTPVLKEQEPHVVVRDKFMRGQAQEGVVFTPDFLKRSMERESSVDLGIVPSEHRHALGKSLVEMAQSNEGGWLEGVGMATIFPKDPGISREDQSLSLLRGLLEPQLGGIAEAAVRVNRAYRKPPNASEGNVRRESSR